MIPDNSVAKGTVRVPEWWLRIVVGLVIVGVAWFYYWTVQTAAAELSMKGQKGDYYNLLIDGFSDGHLYMKRDPDPRLLALPAAERPGTAPFMLDASLYQGHYYLYFGVTPVMVLMLPYAVLTGQDFPEALAAVVMMLVGFCFATWWWWEVRRKFFPRLGAGWVVLGVVALGLCTAAPSALRRPLFYEVAIGAGYAFSMVALWAVSRAWWRPKQRRWWLVISGIAVGLAVGSRANLAPAGLLLLCAGAVGIAWQEASKGVRARLFALGLLAAGGGAGAVGAGLAAYNYARFGSITEFGHHHQMGSNPKQMFRAENLGYNFTLYYLKPPQWNGYFPFVAPAEEGVKPSDYVGREHVHGEWLWTLVAGLAAVTAVVVWARRRDGEKVRWVGVVGLAGLLFGVNVVVVALTGVRANRYMVDFQPELVLVTLAALAAGLARRGAWSRVLGVGVAVLVPAAVAFNVFASMQVHGFFQGTAPATYARVAGRADGVVWPFLRGEAAAVGDREVEVTWPKGNPTLRRETFFATGTRDFRDEIFVEFSGEHQARIAFKHEDYGELMGEWFAIRGGDRAKVRISGAILLPGVAHPWYGGREADERTALKRRLQVRVDGELRFDRDVLSYDSSPRLQQWGEWLQGNGKIASFTGRIGRASVQPADESRMRSQAVARGAIRLKLRLPMDRYGWVEPLLAQGGGSGFDTLAINYVRPGVVRLLHDQLGGGGRWSEEFAVDYTQPQWVEINLPAASDDGIWAALGAGEAKARPDRITVRWNGRVVFRPELPPLPAKPLSLALGVNGWNASGMQAFFAGGLTELPRLEALGEVRPGLLTSRLRTGETLAAERGVWLRLERADGQVAAVVWQRGQDSGLTRFGWIEGGRVNWLAWVEPADVPAMSARLRIPDTGVSGEKRAPTWFDVEVRNKAVFARKTDFFDGSPIKAWGLAPDEWAGAATGKPMHEEARVTAQLPGRLQLRFQLPAGGFVGSDPLLSTGRTGAADSIYLRGIGEGRYVVGLDHWGLPAVESAPINLRSEGIHTLLIELSSLGTQGELPPDRARLVLDGRVALDTAQVLYATRPDEVFFGLNPLGMSTSGATFRGEIVSVRVKAGAEEMR
jgi:hypothetical protein